ncbi:hypothetical protein [Clavibacter sp. VKM Ac-2872]|uniref:hypothetical protein n=1 Tax=Clavibacter sp. VKM Ac-2872 TaxID=2783812 RepID=UPI00188B2BB3|nr:hypothetical protein [Clavibacter sp. VKM Ac-2872]MBF4625511.1 hypothetical protein [Clavibacter sp. VKM Ac-2872]
MIRLVLVLAILGVLSSVPMAVFNGFHLACLLVMVFAAYAVAMRDAKVRAGDESRLDRLDRLGTPDRHVPGDRRA